MEAKFQGHPHRRQKNKINALGQPNMSKNCCVGLYQGIQKNSITQLAAKTLRFGAIYLIQMA
jgi:hypothetical protein